MSRPVINHINKLIETYQEKCFTSIFRAMITGDIHMFSVGDRVTIKATGSPGVIARIFDGHDHGKSLYRVEEPSPSTDWIYCYDHEIEKVFSVITPPLLFKVGTASQFQSMEHDFASSLYGPKTCYKCGVSADDVKNGTASWVCAAVEMDCCKKQGVSKWDHFSGTWVCSSCGATRNTGEGAPYFKKDKLGTPKKCNCEMQVILSVGCKCGGV